MNFSLLLLLALTAVCAVHAAPTKRLLFADNLNTLIHDVVNAIGDGIDTTANLLGQAATNIGNVLGLGTVTNTLTGLVDSVVDKTTDIVGGAVNQLADVVKSGVDGATLGLGNVVLSLANLTPNS